MHAASSDVLTDRTPSIGIIGLGHWFDRLSAGLSSSSIRISKAMGMKSFSERAGRLAELGIGEESYYRGDADGSIPQAFFEGIDAVYISSPNSLHYRQAMQALEHGKYAIVEKTLATNERDFDSMLDYMARNSLDRLMYLHLHYIHKQLTLAMDGILSRATREYGAATGVAATFLEEYRESDRHRKWLFSMGEGGIFMDWIHPYEVLFNGARADSAKLEGVRLYSLHSGYGTGDPSGAEATVRVSGRHFAKGATAMVRVGKGSGTQMKRVRFHFENGERLDFDFLNNEQEFNGARRGSWRLADGAGRVLMSGEPSGPDSSELFARDIVELCNGRNRGLTADEIRRLYAPQWDYQRLAKGRSVESDAASVRRFIDDSLDCRVRAD